MLHILCPLQVKESVVSVSHLQYQILYAWMMPTHPSTSNKPFEGYTNPQVGPACAFLENTVHYLHPLST